MIATLSTLLALAMTLALLSYLVADNPAYRVALHLFIGLSAGYAVVLAWYTVIQPQLVLPLRAGLASGASPAAIMAGMAASLAAGGLGLLLLLKTVRVAGRAGTLVVAVIVGVGAAVSVGGAIAGTLLPQTNAAFVSLLPVGGPLIEGIIEGLFMVVGTLTTLAFFYYGARGQAGGAVERPPLIKPLASIGQLFIGAAFGVMYAGALAASISIFSERSAALWAFAASLVGP